MTTNEKEAPIGDIEALLPWHAAGTLSRSDAKRVDEALARDPELARRYALVREELGETIHLNETLGAPSARAMETLFVKINAEPKRGSAGSTGAGSFSMSSRFTGWLENLTPRTLAFAGGAAVLAIVLQAGFIAGIVLKQPTAGFETASAPSTAPGVGAFTLIRFAPQASVDDINKFLEANKMSIVSGPAPGGLYRVRVGEAALSKDELNGVVKKLQQDKAVNFIVTTQ
jgi:hypothetical protein